jgi:MOSC domain-containing protein YiiM
MMEPSGMLVSPTHAYFGRAREGAADVPTADAEQVQLVAGKGIAGDRFFGQAAHMDAAVTLIAVEALEAMAKELGVEPFNPLLIRRNVVLREARLAPLIGHDFALESSGDRQC